MNKQIEEMAILARGFCLTIDGGGTCDKCSKCDAYRVAEKFYKAGYRKFSDILGKLEEWHEYYEELYQTAKEVIKIEVVTEIISEIEQAIMAHGTKYAMKRLEEIKKKYEVEKDGKAD